MSGLMAFATGFLNGSVEVQREKAAKEIADNEAKAIRQKEAMDRFTNADPTKMPEAVYRALGADAGFTDLGDLTNAFNDAANTIDLGGGMTVPTLGGAELQFDAAGDQAVNANIYWTSFEKAANTNPDALFDYYSNDPRALKALKSRVGRELDVAINQWDNSQKEFSKEGDIYTPWNMEQNYAATVSLLDRLGLGVGEQSAETESKILTSMMPDFDPATHTLIKLRTNEGIVPTAIPKEDHETLKQIATAGNFGDVDELLQYTIPKAVDMTELERSEMTSEQFAWSQNEMIKKAIGLERDFGRVLRENVGLNKEENATLLARLEQDFGDDRMNQVRGLAFIAGGSSKYFKRPKNRNRFSGTVPDTLQPQVSVAQFIVAELGVDSDKFQEGVSAQVDAMNMLDRLASLELSAADKTGTGFVRGAAKLLGELGIQVSQVPEAFSSLFGKNATESNSAFANLKGNTTQESLEAIVESINKELPKEREINLTELSQIDALRLALAAKMARAVDPSGRLSNQDFEIQLRRLAGGNFATPEQIQGNIKLLKEEFSKDLQYKKLVSDMLSDTSKFTPVKASQVQASMKLRTLRHSTGLYGVGGGAATKSAADSAPTGKPPEGSTAIGDGYYYSEDGDIIYDSNGNDVTEAYLAQNLGVET